MFQGERSAGAPDNGGKNPQFTSHPEWFCAFLAGTDQKIVQAKVLSEMLEARYPDVWQRAINPDYSLDLLFLGVGNGISEISFLQHLNSIRGNLKNVNAYCEDPSQLMQRAFKNRAQQAEVDLAIKDFALLKIEDPQYTPPSADITICFQTWHYVHNWEGVDSDDNSLVKVARSNQAKNGVGVISIQSLQSDNYKIRRKFIPIIHGTEEITSEDITAELTRLGLTYMHEFKDAHLNIEDMFSGEDFEPNPKGADLLSFILRTDWNSLSESLKQQIASDIRQIVELRGERVLIFRDGYIFIPNPDEQKS